MKISWQVPGFWGMPLFYQGEPATIAETCRKGVGTNYYLPVPAWCQALCFVSCIYHPQCSCQPCQVSVGPSLQIRKSVPWFEPRFMSELHTLLLCTGSGLWETQAQRRHGFSKYGKEVTRLYPVQPGACISQVAFLTRFETLQVWWVL